MNIRGDTKQYETVEMVERKPSVSYETREYSREQRSPRRQVEYETVERNYGTRHVTRFSYVDVIRRYQTGNAEKDKMLNGSNHIKFKIINYDIKYSILF